MQLPSVFDMGGKTVDKVFLGVSRDYILFSFRDGTYLKLQTISLCSDDDCTPNFREVDLVDYDLFRLGLMTKEEYDFKVHQRKMNSENTAKEFRRRQWEELKKEFGEK